MVPSSSSSRVASDGLAIEVSGLRKMFGDTVVLDGVDLSVPFGARVVVCGPSGSGKSTLLRCLNSLAPIDGGRISIAGSAPDAKPRWHSSDSRIGMVFQSFNLFSHLTVEQNLILAPIKVRGVRRSAALELAHQLLGRVGLSEKADAYPEMLSGGQQQRVAIARALCMEPDILLFDEPTSSLDPEMVQEVIGVIRDLAADAITMVIVTHEMGFAREIASRIIFMDRGKIVEQAAPEDFFLRPREDRTRTFLENMIRHDALPAARSTA